MVVVKIKDGNLYKMSAFRVIPLAFYHPINVPVDLMDGMTGVPGIAPRKKRANGQVIISVIDLMECLPDFFPI